MQWDRLTATGETVLQRPMLQPPRRSLASRYRLRSACALCPTTSSAVAVCCNDCLEAAYLFYYGR